MRDRDAGRRDLTVFVGSITEETRSQGANFLEGSVKSRGSSSTIDGCRMKPASCSVTNDQKGEKATAESPLAGMRRN